MTNIKNRKERTCSGKIINRRRKIYKGQDPSVEPNWLKLQHELS